MTRNIVYILFTVWYLLSANTTLAYTHADTLRGSNGPGRSWWKVEHYDLRVNIDTNTHSILGSDRINFRVIGQPGDSMQIDLQLPLEIDSVELLGDKGTAGAKLLAVREGNVWWVTYPFHKMRVGESHNVKVYYHGHPRLAVHPPWDGGFSWSHDSTGKLWLAVSCQGLGASVWWPCKDAQWEEPESGMEMRFTVPGMHTISNGREVPVSADEQAAGVSAWRVTSPINNYDVTFYIGDYVHWHDTLMGEKGVLDLDFWVLRYNEQRARKQFAVVKQMIHCFEYRMGPYPFYEDGYKLVDAPYLGMEHQGAVAYGNAYKMGYMGWDRSMTGIGLSFDYIIVHESGHEWFGNSVTAKDMADNWIHEGITSFAECFFVECTMGREKALKYSKGNWISIQNKEPVIGHYGVNEEGPEDIYDKGAAIMYMVRMLTNDDEKFRTMMRGLSSEFYHQTVTTKQVEDYIAKHTGLDLTAFFDQYLRRANIPELEYAIKDDELSYRFNGVVAGFTLPITVTGGDESKTINVTEEWQHIKWKGGYNVKFVRDYLFKIKQ